MLKQQTQLQPTILEKTILNLFKRLSVCLIVLGRRGSGKTDISFLVLETLAKFSVIPNFATNVKVYENPLDIEHITNLQDLEHWCQTTVGRKLFILDEAGKSLRRRTPMSKLNVQLLDDLQILRKYKLSIIFIAPHDKYIDSAALGSDVLDAEIIKTNFKNPKIALYIDLLENFDIGFTDIPATLIPFDTWDVAPFRKNAPPEEIKFANGDLQILWRWSNGETYKALDIHPMKLNRICRRFIKDVLENKVHNSHNKAIEDNMPPINSQNSVKQP